RSPRRAAHAGPCRTSPDPAREWLRRWSFLFPSLRVLDRLGQSGAFLVDPSLSGVGLRECIGELDRIVADYRAHGRAIGRGTLPEVGEVAEHLDGGLAVQDAPVVHEVPLQRLRDGAVRLGQSFDAGLYCLYCFFCSSDPVTSSIHFGAITCLLRGAVPVAV